MEKKFCNEKKKEKQKKNIGPKKKQKRNVVPKKKSFLPELFQTIKKPYFLRKIKVN